MSACGISRRTGAPLMFGRYRGCCGHGWAKRPSLRPARMNSRAMHPRLSPIDYLRLLAHVLDRRPAVPSRRQTITSPDLLVALRYAASPTSWRGLDESQSFKTSRFHLAAQRGSSRMAARGKGAAGADADDRIARH